MKSILFLNRVYPPGPGATGQLLAELAEALAGSGWRVTVVTSRAEGMARTTETVNGVRIERVPALPFTRAHHWKRAVSYLTLYPTLLWRALVLPRADVVVTMTDPPLHLLLGLPLKAFKRARLVHWGQDLYPEAAEELGVFAKGGVLAAALRRLSSFALRRHDRIIAVGRCMKARLIHRGLDPDSIEVIPNWGHSPRVNLEAGQSPFRREQGWENRFVVMYSGHLGLAHPFEAILDAAEHLQPVLSKALFVFVGGGPRLSWVKAQAQGRRLHNVQFLPAQPKERLTESLAGADLHLATMNENLFGLVVPSKVYGILSAGRPCIFLGPAQSEAAQFILQHGCGSVLNPADGIALAGCLTQWMNDPNRQAEAARRVRSVAGLVRLETALAAFERALQALRPEPTAGGASQPSRLVGPSAAAHREKTA